MAVDRLSRLDLPELLKHTRCGNGGGVRDDDDTLKDGETGDHCGERLGDLKTGSRLTPDDQLSAGTGDLF